MWFQSDVAEATEHPTMLLISDLHFNPFHDPKKVKELSDAPAKDWEAIFARGDSATQAVDFEALRTACKLRGIDTPYSLFSSAMKAIHRDAARAAFITVTGDMLAHSFECMYEKTQQDPKSGKYSEFTAKTMEYEMLQLRHAAPDALLYFAIGNNDSDCGDYRLDLDEPWFGLLGKVAAANLGKTWDSAAAQSFAHGGYYNVKMPAPMQNTRMISVNDMYLAGGYKTCSGVADPEAGKSQVEWLKAQLNDARAHHEHVWIMAHIPIGISPYATFLQQIRKMNLCKPEGMPNTYLPTDLLTETLSKNADVIKLALFGHTHVDEFKLVEGADGRSFPLKITPALTVIGGNLPSFTVADIDIENAQIADYTVVSSTDKEGTSFAKEYTYSEAYGHKGLTPKNLRAIIDEMRKDTTLSTKLSQNYVLNWSVGAIRNQIQPAWPGYVCGMDMMNPSAYKQCVCESPLGTLLK